MDFGTDLRPKVKKKKKLTPFIHMGSLKKGPIIIYFCHQYELVYAQYIYPIFQ